MNSNTRGRSDGKSICHQIENPKKHNSRIALTMRLLPASVLILLNIASVAADTGKAEPPKFHPDEKPPKFNRGDGTDVPAGADDAQTDRNSTRLK